MTELKDCRLTQLEVRNLLTNQTRSISHCKFLSWSDLGVPKTPSQILDLIEIVHKSQQQGLETLETTWLGHPQGPPICVHCTAGIGRTGTFCAIDISLKRLKDSRKVDIFETIRRIRTQRAQSVETAKQYVYCHLALIEFATRENLIQLNENLDLLGEKDFF
jgi:protein tyrosine phosphatase